MQRNKYLEAILNKPRQCSLIGIITAVVVIGAGAIFIFWPILSGKRLFGLTLYHYIYFTMMQHYVYGLGILPNWWPAYNSGYPVSLTLDAFLNPVFIAALKFLPAFLANNLMILMFFVINGLSLYALARALKLSRTASIVAMISYAFSGVIMEYTPITGITALMPFLPLSFLCCLKIFEGKTRWFWFWLPLLIYSWIGGWSEMIVYALVAIGLFGIYLVIKNRHSENFSYYRPAMFFGAIAASVIVLLPWFLSILNFISYSSRNGGRTVEAAAYMPTTISHLLYIIYPRLTVFNGELLPLIHLNGYGYFLFIGMLPLFLVIASFLIQNKKEKKYLLFFMGLFGAAILMTVDHSPLFWLFHQIPVLKWFGGYWKWSFIIVFSSAILAGYGIDHIKDFFNHRFSKKILIAFWIIMIMSLLGAGLITIFDQQIKSAVITYGIAHYKNTPDRALPRSDNYYRNVIKDMTDSLVNAFSLKNRLMLLTIGLWLLTLIHFTVGKYGLMPQEQWRLLAIPVTLLGSSLIWTGFLNGPPVSYLKTEPATAHYLHSVEPYTAGSLPLTTETAKTLTPYRIYLYTPDQYVSVISEKYDISLAQGQNNQREQLSYEIMEDNAHLNFNFDTFQNHQTLTLQRLQDMGYLVRQQGALTQEQYLNNSPFIKYVKDFSNKDNFKILGALNIKYIISPIELGGELSPIFTTHVINNKVPVYIYQNPYFMPRWYFANMVKWTEANDKAAIQDFKTIDDFKKVTLLEKLNVSDPAIITKPDLRDNFEVELYAPGKLLVKTNTKNYRFLIFSESKVPFWQASINGETTPLYTANYLYQAVLVPPGENMVEFRYPDLRERAIISLQALLSKQFPSKKTSTIK